MKAPFTPPLPHNTATAHGHMDLCAGCPRRIHGKCRWEPGDYCQAIRSK